LPLELRLNRLDSYFSLHQWFAYMLGRSGLSQTTFVDRLYGICALCRTVGCKVHLHSQKQCSRLRIRVLAIPIQNAPCQVYRLLEQPVSFSPLESIEKKDLHFRHSILVHSPARSRYRIGGKCARICRYTHRKQDSEQPLTIQIEDCPLGDPRVLSR
jgi:hypothetical protein